MDQSSHEIQREREHTRAALTEKIELLEERVRDTKQAVKQQFDYRYQTQKQPWKMLGASVGIGYLIGKTVGSSPSRRSMPVRQTRGAEVAQKLTLKGAIIGAVIPMLIEFVKTATLRTFSSRRSSTKPTSLDQSRVLTPFREDSPHYPAAARVSNKPGGER
jgi:hypothetical protein